MENEMNNYLKTVASAFGGAVLALSILSTAASAAQAVRGSVYGPYYNPHYQSNGTGTVPDWNRDPHNDR
jgi:hypothetical protein